MTSHIDWSNITNGYNGFEELAFEYVRMEYPSHNGIWKQTSKTRDGNKDALIVFGYQDPSKSNEQWWMEAKYSTAEEKLTRYRLDATIVSAILQGDVKKVIFVTNITVKAKVISDIRSALQKSLKIKDVYFCTKPTIEYWLYKNETIYHKFFNTNISLSIPDEFFVIDNIEFYSAFDKKTIYPTPQDYLESNQKYIASFSLFSNRDIKSIKLKINKKYGNNFFFANNKDKSYILSLKKGENEILVDIIVDRDVNNIKEINDVFFKIFKLDILTKKSTPIMQKHNLEFEIDSQNKIYNNLSDALDRFYKNEHFELHCIEGAPYTGKSYLINKILELDILNLSDVFYAKMGNDNSYNNFYIVKLITFLFFPYIHLDELDEEYFKNLSCYNIYIASFLKELIVSKNDPDKLNHLINSFDSSQSISIELPYLQAGVARIIAIDNFHKLSYCGQKFITNFITRNVTDGHHHFYILSMESQILNTEIYKQLADVTPIYYHTCDLKAPDVVNAFNKSGLINFDIQEDIVGFLFDNIVSFFFFIKYLNDVKQEIHTINDLRLSLEQFKRNDMEKHYILRKFQNINNNEKAKYLCNQIYMSHNGLIVNLEDSESLIALEILLQNELVKRVDERYVPKYDSYLQIYKKSSHSNRTDKIIKSNNKFETLHNEILISNERNILIKAAQDIINLKEQEKYYSILYILTDLFENQANEFLKNEIGELLYYKLFYTYAYATANQSTTNSGISIFEKIYEEIKFTTSQEIKEICIDTISEIINSKYESLLFEDASILINDLSDKLSSILVFKPKDQQNRYTYLSFTLAESIKILILSETTSPNTEVEFLNLIDRIEALNMYRESAIYKFRYARTLYATDMGQALTIIKIAISTLDRVKETDGKFSLLMNFERELLELIMSNDYSKFRDLLEKHKLLKDNYFNDYRKSSHLISSIFYKHNLVSDGNEYFFSELKVVRKLRPRQEGFYLQNLALYELINSKVQNSIEHLESAKIIFSNINSYLRIIEHNLELVNSNHFDKAKIDFIYDGILTKGVYYIDPRTCW